MSRYPRLRKHGLTAFEMLFNFLQVLVNPNSKQCKAGEIAGVLSLHSGVEL